MKGWGTAVAVTIMCLLSGVTFGAGAPAGGNAPRRAVTPMLPGAGSKDPVNIDADKLDYFDKEQKLIYTGNVVAVQGDSTLKASELTIFLDRDTSKPADKQGGAETAAASAAAGGPPADGPGQGQSSVRHMDAKGPVTLVSKDQVGTGDSATYDKSDDKVTMTGHVTLTQGTSVTKGDRLIYDMTSGEAQVFSGQSKSRVSSVFVPGSGSGSQPSGTPAPAGGKSNPSPKKKPVAKPNGLGTASAQ